MKTLFWIVKLLLFFIAISLALKNTDIITVRYYLGLQWQAPLIYVMLLVFGLGVIAGVFANLAHFMRLRSEISRLRKTAAEARTTLDAIPMARISDT